MVLSEVHTFKLHHFITGEVWFCASGAVCEREIDLPFFIGECEQKKKRDRLRKWKEPERRRRRRRVGVQQLQPKAH